MTPQSFITACCLTLAGVGCLFAPAGITSVIRGIMIDALRPGFEAVRVAKQSLPANFSQASISDDSLTPDATAELTAALNVAEERNRALQIRMAQIAEHDAPEANISPAIAKSRRLFLPNLIDAAVLGDAIAEQWRSGKLLDQGTNKGLRENELVISTRKSKSPLLDLGDDADISTEDALLLGRCVIGKIAQVGRWTSTFHLVTDSHYRGRAQLIRETSTGQFIFEAQGILKGQGKPLCKLEGIAAETAVHVGDAVYTADRDGLLPHPLYYGEVVEAVLGADDREWTVMVKPVALPGCLTTVQVLRMAVNPERLAVRQ